MAYIDYIYYKEFSKGKAIPEETFDNLINEVTAFIDLITFNRVKTLELVQDEVKNATCAIINAKNKIDTDGGIKTNESVGSYSVTYAGVDANSTEYKKLYDVAKIYLANTDLLYRGL